MKKQLITVSAMLISIAVFGQMQDSATIQHEIKTTVETVGSVAESTGIPAWITGIVTGVAGVIGGWFIHRAKVRQAKKDEKRK